MTFYYIQWRYKCFVTYYVTFEKLQKTCSILDMCIILFYDQFQHFFSLHYTYVMSYSINTSLAHKGPLSLTHTHTQNKSIVLVFVKNTTMVPHNHYTWVVGHAKWPIGKTNTPLEKELQPTSSNKIVILVLSIFLPKQRKKKQNKSKE